MTQGILLATKELALRLLTKDPIVHVRVGATLMWVVDSQTSL